MVFIDSRPASSPAPVARSTRPFIHLLPPTLPLLLSLEVVQQDIPLLALLTPIANDNATAVNNLASISFTVQHAETSPFAEHLSIGHLDERDLVFRAEGDDQLLVGLLFASFVENAHVGLSAIEGFGCFAQAAG